MIATQKQKAENRFDGDIARDAYRQMKANLEVPDDRLHVRVTGGVATLSGAVQYEEQKRAAETCVRAVAGVRDVVNEILVDPASSAALS